MDCRHRGPIVVLALLLSGSPGCGPSSHATDPTELNVAAASDLQFALDEVVRSFRARNADVNVRVTYGSSGTFYGQFLNDAPFDLFLSADLAYPRRLKEQRRVLDTSEFTYAIGRVVVWTLSRSSVDVERLKMDSLRDAAVRHIAIANPAHAPYGQAAEAAMRSFGVYEAVKHKLVMGENVAQALQFVESGAADVGIVALPLALAPSVRSMGRYWEVPTDACPRVYQGGVILRSARNVAAAWRFRSFLLGPSGLGILQRHGFFAPEG
jgi:molybdate transport system substrate-binding protein